jgi:cytoskeletal protein CcmA (bactofilin family)
MAATKNAGSVIAESVVVTGRVTGDGDLEVRGRIDGEIDIQGDLTLVRGSIAKASLAGARVTIGGAVVGDITATDAIVLEATARVVGNLRAPRIALALGAQIRGDLDMGEIEGTPRARPAAAAAPRAARAPAPPARPVVVQRKNPPPPAAAAPAARRAPPEPVVPAIKKGAKAAKKRA